LYAQTAGRLGTAAPRRRGAPRALAGALRGRAESPAAPPAGRQGAAAAGSRRARASHRSDRHHQKTIEAETKKRNAVLFGLPEAADDLAAVRQLVSDADPDDESLKITATDVAHVFRDGPHYPDALRFLKVDCSTSAVQHAFIALVNKELRKDHADLRARPDFTWDQREAGRKLREKLKTMTDPHKFYIDYGKHCIVSKSDRVNVFSLSTSASATANA